MCVCTLCCACLSVHVCVFSSALWGNAHSFCGRFVSFMKVKYVVCVLVLSTRARMPPSTHASVFPVPPAARV